MAKPVEIERIPGLNREGGVGHLLRLSRRRVQQKVRDVIAHQQEAVAGTANLAEAIRVSVGWELEVNRDRILGEFRRMEVDGVQLVEIRDENEAVVVGGGGVVIEVESDEVGLGYQRPP